MGDDDKVDVMGELSNCLRDSRIGECASYEQSLRLLQVERVETFGELAVDGRQKIVGLSSPNSLAADP
jgi:hypothetical protein